MFIRLLIKVKFRYLIFICFLGLILNIKLFFISFFFIFLKLYLSSKKIIFLVLFYTFITFFIYELIDIKSLIDKTDYYTESNIQYDINKNYGYYPKRNSEFVEKIFYKDNLLRVNKYTINEHGHRKTINFDINTNECIVFFGGSIIFGQSLNDDETLPHYVSIKLNGEKKVFNFAFNGYGPHQFLSKIGNNYLDKLKTCKKLDFIYLYINDHIGRVVGKRSWGDKSPRYIFKGYDLTQKGFFSSYPFKLIMKFRKNVRNSKILSIFYDIEKTNKKDQLLFVQILDEIEKKSKNININSNFYYIIWDKENLKYEIINNFFKSKKTLNINNLNIPIKYHSNNIPGDNHPKKEFNELLSNELIKLLLVKN